MLVQQALHHAALMTGQPEEGRWMFWVFLTESAFEVCKPSMICQQVHDVFDCLGRAITLADARHKTFVEGDVALVLVTGNAVPACKLLHTMPADELG